MATRADYRTELNNKMVGIEDEGYGDLEFADVELDTYIELAALRLYPAVYKRSSLDAVTVTGYGSKSFGYVSVTDAERVFLIEDTTELEPVTRWSIRPGRVIGIDTNVSNWSEVNVYYHDAYVMPNDDVTDAGIPAMYTPLLVLGALIEALESRHDTGIRGDPQPHGYHSETQLLDRLMNRYAVLKEEIAMSLPAVVV